MRTPSIVPIALLAALALNSVPALAGTTGSINGFVTSATGAPEPGVKVTVVSPSQTASVNTDSSGRFTFLSLAPDTYTVSAAKEGFETATVTGISVFADQSQSLHLAVTPALRTIARVTTRSSMDMVKPGTTTDVYSVNSAVTQAVQGVGGGGNLNNAYSAIATVPGTFVPPNQQGWDQVVYIRGGNFDQIGYEFDGVPVNRSFDNYPGGTAGTLGQQQLQVYTGGGTAGESATGLAGFINQVIKTGTFPGYASVNAGVGFPTYYHNLAVEVGGATPDRLFSYYAGMGGYNQDYRYLDQFNGASLGDTWGFPVIADNTSTLINFPGVYPTCVATPPLGSGFYDGPNPSPVNNPFGLNPSQPGYLALPKGVHQDPGCYQTISPAYASYSNIADRESVFNVHIGIPHKKDGGRDDVQLLYSNDMLFSQYYSSANDLGPNLVPQLNQVRGLNTPYLVNSLPEIWGDFVTWPTGTYFGENAANVHAVPYFEPNTPGGRCANVLPFYNSYPYKTSNLTYPMPPGSCAPGTFSAIPADTRDGFWNNAAIVKAQYQHNMGSNAYFRIYGYTFYSDWLQNGPLSWSSGLFGLGVLSYDYELNSHTRGAAFQFADQMTSDNLVTFDANYTTATTERYNNNNYNNYLNTPATNYTNGVNCFDPSTGKRAPCNDPSSSGVFGDPAPAISHPVPGASWQVTYTGNAGFYNTVTPNFTALALQDKWNPNDKLNINFGLRDEQYVYNLTNTQNAGQNFWFAAGQQEFCYNPVTLQPVVIPAKPATGFPSTPFIGFTCPMDKSIPAHPVQTVHPDGLHGHLLLSNQYNPTETLNAFTPQVGLTYSVNPDTVLRFSAGRYAQEPQTYQVQYNSKDNNLAYFLFQAFWQYGFTTPRHDALVQYSNNFDASFERRFKGTDMSMKLTPYYRYATNQIYNIGLPFGLGGGLNSGTERIDGVEFEFTKGDFNKDGLSLILSYTYTNSAEMWNNFPGTTINPIDPYNQNILNFNGLTKAGGGSPCYQIGPGQGVNGLANCVNKFPHASAAGNVILNPYYHMAPQPLLDRNGWYPVGLDFPYLSPNVASAVVNYRHRKFAITPALTFNEGEQYGNPADVSGIDPRTCFYNSSYLKQKSSPGTPFRQADYTSCSLADAQNGTSPGTLYIPDPTTGHFDTFGAFRQPSQMNLSLQMSYDVTPRVKISLLMANLVNACFSGTPTAWSGQYPPNSYTCGYVGNSYYVSNFYNGTSPNDVKANGTALNPAFRQPFIPAWADSNAFVIPGPFNAFVQASVKI